jgi:hypothetical protein
LLGAISGTTVSYAVSPPWYLVRPIEAGATGSKSTVCAAFEKACVYTMAKDVILLVTNDPDAPARNVTVVGDANSCL